MRQGVIRAICVSSARGTEKHEITQGRLVENWGLEGDAHGGDWHRQISLLSLARVEAFNALGADVKPGAFGENLLVSGIDFSGLPVGTRLKVGDALLELTQIGKQCHTHCKIYHRMGDCIMPREGVFARVLKGGMVQIGDGMEILPGEDAPRAAVITLSDRCSSGQRQDLGGPLAAEFLEKAGYRVDAKLLLPDERDQLQEALIDLCDRRQVRLIITTGGTGFSPRDITPEATLAVAERNAPGIAEALRAESMKTTPRAMLSRGVSVIRGRTLIVNLPGSPKAVEEYLSFLLPTLSHGLEILSGQGDA